MRLGAVAIRHHRVETNTVVGLMSMEIPVRIAQTRMPTPLRELTMRPFR